MCLTACTQDSTNEEAASSDISSSEADSLTICSFNIQFLGHFKKRDDKALADILKDYDIVVIQELVAPPIAGTYPDDEAYTADPESAEFFEAMEEQGFSYKLSEEDTGTGDEIHKSSSATEWWVAFYKPASVECVSDIPCGFLAEDRSNHDDYERVPYAFAFRTPDEKLDFVLISVHLEPNGGTSHKARRKHELSAIANWIDVNDDEEKDFIILGDMNIEDEDELADATPSGYLSLNDECRTTNTNINDPKPYDHVMYNTTFTTEIDSEFDLEVINLIEAMEDFWTSTEDEYPGEPYNHNLFKQHYSDHHPVVFRIKVSDEDDD
ncbi:MAG: endonuclease/exonuclease/phosphatase family protein [Candidatus Hodarchaeota archaeon]